MSRPVPNSKLYNPPSMESAGKPEISVLIPAHDGARWIDEALGRLEAASAGVPTEAVVVDNASVDETPSICRKTPGVRLLRNDANLGFSRAVNQAAAACRGGTLVVINQDLHLEPGALRHIHEFLSANDALVGGALAFEDGRRQPSYGPFPTLIGTLGRLALPREIRKYELAAPPSSGARPVDWLTGAFIGFRRSLFERLGGFDEDYFMYYEDADFCLRARRAGVRSYFLPSAKAVHLHPYSSRRDAPDWLRREIRLSQIAYFRKHRPRWEQEALRLLNCAHFTANGWAWQ